MLRQVFILIQGKIVIQHQFAQAYNKVDLETVFSKIKEFIDNPMPNQLMHKPLLDFQIVFGQLGKVFYLFVTDQADRFNYVEDEIKILSKKMNEFSLTLTNGELESATKDKITDIIQEIHGNLHSKITFVGPVGSGKTSLMNILAVKEIPAKDIMTFAQVKKLKIDELSFDLWDFIINDDFSPLWNNFIRGSDLILLVLDASQIVEAKVMHFINTCKRESKFSKVLILLSHSDLKNAMSEERFSELYSEALKAEIISYNINDPNITGIIRMGLISALQLKKPLPDNFSTLLIEANNAITEKNYLKALANMRSLVKIAEDYQELAYLDTFNKKIKELEERQAEEQKQKELEKTKIKAPEKIEFKEKIMVKSLPLPIKQQTTIKEQKINNISAKSIDEVDKFLQSREFGNISEEPQQPSKQLEPEKKMIKNEEIIKQEQIKKEEKPAIAPLEPIKKRQDYAIKKDFDVSEKVIDRPTAFEGIKDKKLTFERSPMVKDEIIRNPSTKVALNDVVFRHTLEKSIAHDTEDKYKKIETQENLEKKQNLHQLFREPTSIDNSIQLQQDKMKELQLKSEQESLFKEIQGLGKSLSLDLCGKFIIQIRAKLNKERLDETDIKNAAALYVKRLEDKNK